MRSCRCRLNSGKFKRRLNVRGAIDASTLMSSFMVCYDPIPTLSSFGRAAIFPGTYVAHPDKGVVMRRTVVYHERQICGITRLSSSRPIGCRISAQPRAAARNHRWIPNRFTYSDCIPTASGYSVLQVLGVDLSQSIMPFPSRDIRRE